MPKKRKNNKTKTSSQIKPVELSTEIFTLSSDDEMICVAASKKSLKMKDKCKKNISQRKDLPTFFEPEETTVSPNCNSTSLKIKRGIIFDYDNTDVQNLEAEKIIDTRIAEFEESLKIRRKELEANALKTSEKKENVSQEESKNNSNSGLTNEPGSPFLKELRNSSVKESDSSDDCVISEESPNVSQSQNPPKFNRIRRRIEKEQDAVNKLCSYTVPDDSSENEEIVCLSESESRINREISIYIQCNCKIIPFSMKKEETFARIFTELSKMFNKKVSEVLLCKGDTTIHFQDTPIKLKLSKFDIIDCIFWNPEMEKNVKKVDFINVKIQSSDLKTRSVLNIHKLEPFSNMMEEYSKLRGISLGKMVFSFDGEKINPKETPVDLDMEDDNIIDVVVL